MSHPTKLRALLEEAKEHLRGAEQHQARGTSQLETTDRVEPARSKLNTLLGRTTVKPRQTSLFQQVGVAQRPTYDLIADRVLGKDVGEHRSFLDRSSAYAEHVAERLRHLQERLNAPPPDDTSPVEQSDYVGVDRDGRPVWMQILDEHRGRASSAPQAPLAPPASDHRHHATRVLDIEPTWPTKLAWSTHRTFKQWFVCEENFEATQRCEVAVDAPGQRINLLHIAAEPQSGCTHLLQATGQALLRRQDGHVLQISAADLSDSDAFAAGWRDALADAVALLVDDVHEFATDDVWSHQLGLLVDHALNLGIQVVVGGRGAFNSHPPSRLKELLATAVSVELIGPSVPTLMAYGRWRCVQRNLLVSEQHLAQLARIQPTGWRAMNGRLEQLSLAFEQGAVLLDHDDVTSVLSPSISVPSASTPSPQRVEDLATQLVGEALDSVYSSLEPGGIELHMPLEPMPDDEYTPPAWDESTFAQDRPDGFESRLKQVVESVTPGRPSVLDVHERERYLLSDESLRLDDIERAVDVLVELDSNIDQRMSSSSSAVKSSTSELNSLEEQMVELAQRATTADIEELIVIADELRSLEERLVELDPDREPLPPFEEDTVPRRHRRASRRSSSNRSSSVPRTDESLDEFEPDGEWHIDGADIQAEDLLEAPIEEKQLVHLARLRPKQILQGEEE